MLADAQDFADSDAAHDFDDGPHVVSGPVAVTGARPGDLIAVTTSTGGPLPWYRSGLEYGLGGAVLKDLAERGAVRAHGDALHLSSGLLRMAAP